MTPMNSETVVDEIPRTLAQFFQEYTFENLDAERDAELVIERTLAWGNRAELRWLFGRYGRARVAEWVRRKGWGYLPKRRFNYWCLMLDVVDPQKRQGWQSRIWPH
jgi:hypothetical protein